MGRIIDGCDVDAAYENFLANEEEMLRSFKLFRDSLDGEEPNDEKRLAARVRRYGITASNYEEMLETQNGACAICRKKPRKPRRDLYVDHDHETEEVRGLLCSRCNTLIGFARDDVALLRAAAGYLDTTH